MQRYQWLLFDADGTLFDFERSESVAFREVFRALGIEFDPAYLLEYRRISKTLWHAVEQGQLTPNLLKVRRFELLLPAIGVTGSPAAFSDLYIERLAACAELINDAAEVLHALSQKHRMAILTNGLKPVQRGRFARSTIHHHFADIIISDEIGVAKPAREFFEITMARLGQPARQETLMIGDSWNADILGAVNYGLDACWYNPGRKSRPDASSITREIATLRELVDWLA